MLKEDFYTAVWVRLKDDLEVRLEELRRMNDAYSLNSEQTALIRGQIKEVKRILSLAPTGASEGPEVDPV